MSKPAQTNLQQMRPGQKYLELQEQQSELCLLIYDNHEQQRQNSAALRPYRVFPGGFYQTAWDSWTAALGWLRHHIGNDGHKSSKSV